MNFVPLYYSYSNSNNSNGTVQEELLIALEISDFSGISDDARLDCDIVEKRFDVLPNKTTLLGSSKLPGYMLVG